MRKILFLIVLTCLIPGLYSQIQFQEGFNGETFPPAGWTITPATGTIYWSRVNTSAYCLGTGSAKFNFFNAPANTTQSLTTPNYTPSPLNFDSLVFHNAYATYQTEVDKLEILASTNGGGAWTSLTILNGGTNGPLVTAPPSTSAFTPSCNQWKRQAMILPVGTNKIQFKTISAYGNNLYLDSIIVKRGNVVGINQYSNELPGEYKLHNNYPNPFNPSTSIKFDIPKAGLVLIVIYDMTGKEIARLVNENLNAGKYETTFNASNISSGVYFYKLLSEGYTDTKKMILVK